jgi:hypothetical protein
VGDTEILLVGRSSGSGLGRLRGSWRWRVVRQLLDGASLTELSDYFKLMLAFDITFVCGGLGLFGHLIEQ